MSTSTPDPRPRRADAVRNRARVLAAARELLDREGVDVPIDAIARRAGVGPGTVHRHFPTKETLLAEVVIGDLERRLTQARERLTCPNPASGLRELLHGLLDDGMTNAALKAALAQTSFELNRMRPAAVTELHDVLAALLAAAQRGKLVRDDIDTDDVKAVLAAALAAQSHPALSQERAMHARRVVLDGLRPPQALPSAVPLDQ